MYEDKNINTENFSYRKYEKNTQLESYLPLNNFIDLRDLQTFVEWKSSFSGGEAGGTGQQNNSLRIDYGYDENTLFTFYFAEADDTLYEKIKGALGAYSWQNFAISYKKSLFQIDEKNYDYH